jgi:hypothetical protein
MNEQFIAEDIIVSRKRYVVLLFVSPDAIDG